MKTFRFIDEELIAPKFKLAFRAQALKLMTLLFLLFGMSVQSQAAMHSMPHEMQHGFILSADDTFASHLVATGHHSWQTEIVGSLLIEDPLESETYKQRKSQNPNGEVYFLFQAQNLDLPSIQVGQILNGHIVESQVTKYEPKNVIVKNAKFKVEKVLLNLPNPFFAEE